MRLLVLDNSEYVTLKALVNIVVYGLNKKSELCRLTCIIMFK